MAPERPVAKLMPVEQENCQSDRPATTSTEKPGLAVALFFLAKPGIIIAEVLTGLAGMQLASFGSAAAAVHFPTLIAIALAAGGAAMVNGILDTNADRLMPRLARRCRALETVGHGRLLIIALFLLGGGLTLAAITSPPLVMALLAGGCISYLWLYTAWLKRSSPWAAVAGAIPGALPPLIGSASVSGDITAAPLLLALFIFIWQLPHFWLLALESQDQYAKAGIPVLPLIHGESLTKILIITTAALLLPLSLALGLFCSMSSVYLAMAGVAGILFLLICARCLYLTHAYQQGFRASLFYLITISGAVCIESFLR